MTMKTTVCATAVALVAGAACFPVQAEAQSPGTPASQFKVLTSHGSKKLYMSAGAVYDAGVRRGSARSSHDAYLRGFRDGTSTTAYTSRQYVVNAAPVYSPAPVYSAAPTYAVAPTYSAAPAYGYSSYGRDAAYAPAVAGYSYSGGTVAVGDSYGDGYASGYGNGYGYSQYNAGQYNSGQYNAGQYSAGPYNAGYAPRGLMDVAVTPVVVAQPLEAQNARLSYCAARYQSFDPASGTFLADDGYRHYCR
jgi:hypothetical protein